MRFTAASSAEDVVKVLRDRLDETGRTQQQLAADLGITTKHMSQMLTGKAGISLPMLFRILHYSGAGITLAPAHPTRTGTP
jgi:plasmid maintenance system antidote protein VapI